jgi:hypothetical protein
VNVWELSGLEEGDIMQEPGEARNAVRDPQSLWKDATIPYILDPTFSKLSALEYRQLLLQ